MERYCPTLKYQLVYNTSIVCQVMLLRIWKSQVIVLLPVFLTTFLLISMKLGLSLQFLLQNTLERVASPWSI